MTRVGEVGRTALTLFLVMSLGGSAIAQSPPREHQENSQDGSAYFQALLCTVANANASGDRRFAGDDAKAKQYHSQMEHDYRIAQGLGDVLGKSHATISADLRGVQGVQLPKMAKDQQYFYRVVANCKYYKLM